MISYEIFKKSCIDELREELKAFDNKEVENYLKGNEVEKVVKQFYELGVDRFENGKKHHDELAFGYCVNTAVDNLRMMF